VILVLTQCFAPVTGGMSFDFGRCQIDVEDAGQCDLAVVVEDRDGQVAVVGGQAGSVAKFAVGLFRFQLFDYRER